MTETAARAGYFARRLLPIAAAAVVVAGCSTTNLEDVAPVASMQAPQALPDTMVPPPAGEPAVPASADQAAALPAPAEPGAVATNEPAAATPPVRDAVDTGTFPNLNVPAGTAAPQFTPAERTSKLAELGAKRAATQSGPSTNASAEAAKIKRLRKLAQSHATEALKEIEAE